MHSRSRRGGILVVVLRILFSYLSVRVCATRRGFRVACQIFLSRSVASRTHAVSRVHRPIIENVRASRNGRLPRPVSSATSIETVLLRTSRTPPSRTYARTRSMTSIHLRELYLSVLGLDTSTIGQPSGTHMTDYT